MISSSKIFLDGGDPEESRKVKELLGFLDGQTTNPTLISRNPQIKARLERGEKLSNAEAYKFYRGVVEEIAQVTSGPISIEAYADRETKAEEMLAQGREMFTWISNGNVKYPTTHEGLEAAEQSVKEGIRVNLTLCFSQEQAAAVYSATRGTKEPAFVSPFIGRLDDQGENGMDLIKNILEMYKGGDGHVQTLTASVRSVDHLLYAVHLGSPLITAPFKILEEWAKMGKPLPPEDFKYDAADLKPILYKETPLDKPWASYDIHHDLTDTGIEKFSADWNAIVAS